MEEQVKIINGGVSVDDRGSLKFVNDFNFEGIKRFYQVQNHRRGFIRAWHGHKKEAKYVYVIKGTALIGAIPLKTFDGPLKFILSDKSPKILYIPSEYANGAMTLEDDTIIQYFSTSTLEESKGDDIRFPYDKWNIWTEDFR
jgi:dTDP-4-dehydrorhamnose 3,5-epimerase